MKRCILVLTLLSLTIVFTLMFFNITGNSDSLYYSTEMIEVKKLDTLWNIASRVNDGSYNNHKLIDIIININDLDGVIIQPGQNIQVPVLSKN